MSFIQVDQEFMVEVDVSTKNSGEDTTLWVGGQVIILFFLQLTTRDKRPTTLIDPESNSGEEYFSPMKTFQLHFKTVL